MTKIEGIKANESVFHRIRCTYQELLGDLVLTNKGIVFIEIKGMLGLGRERLHQFKFDEISRIQTKKKKSGIYTHGIVIDHKSEPSELQSNYYSCEEYKAVLFLAFFERRRLLLKATEEISSTIQSLSTIKRNADLLTVAKNSKMRPYFYAFCLNKIEAEILSLLENGSDVDIIEVAMSKKIHSLIALLHESDSRKIPKDQVYYTVIDLVDHLISQGDLDGILTKMGRYVSNRVLARIKLPFDMLNDFETIFVQLKEKGLLIWVLECPSCFRKIKYPEKGKTVACQFCGAEIYALDVFEKFRAIF